MPQQITLITEGEASVSSFRLTGLVKIAQPSLSGGNHLGELGYYVGRKQDGWGEPNPGARDSLYRGGEGPGKRLNNSAVSP